MSDNKLGDYWLTDVPKPEYKIFEPWPSAFSQSRGISILLRGYQLTNQKEYLAVATQALKIFDVSSSEGGVTTFTEHGPFYEEYPAPFPTMVLDGMLFALCGLYDFIRVQRRLAVKNNKRAQRLFDDGIQCVKKSLPQYDLNFWIRYNYCREPFYPEVDPATIGYLRLVVTQLKLFYDLTGEKELRHYAEKWRSYDQFFNILRMYRIKYSALRKMNRL